MKLWDKGYKMDKDAEEYSVGNDYILDKELLKYDCLASIAHARMLGKVGLLSSSEVNKLTNALEEIIELVKEGEFKISKEQEDCHTAIEQYLTEHLGDLGMKIHTGRSRNDQVLTALRLYEKDHLKSTIAYLEKLKASLKALKQKYGSVKFPGYTHMRKAMPSSLAMWCDAFIESIDDDIMLVNTAIKLVDQSPLGSGAGYGLPLKTDRSYTAKALGFAKVQQSPIYAQNSRGKFESVIVNILASIMLDVNRMSSDIILFSMSEFGYFIIPKEFSTGSSIMPHKKNPDVLEVARGNYHVVRGYESMLSGISSDLISGYNRDIQLTKEPTIKSFALTESTINVVSLLICKLHIDPKRCADAMGKELESVAEAYKMAAKGVPFRKAYKEVAKKYK